MSYCAKLTGEDLSHYINKIESVGLRKNLAPENDINLTRLKSVYVSLPHIMAARTADIDKNEEITSLSPNVYDFPCTP